MPTADHLPDAGEMIETAAPVGERESFERTMMDKYGWQNEDFKLDDFGYADGQTDTAWMAWQARASLSAGDAGWQPIETAPKDGTQILAYIHIDDGDIGVMKWMDFGQGLALWVWSDELMGEVDPDPYQPTHWMPLPPPPSAIRARGEAV